MKSIKPGRGPSRMHMVSSIGAALFGVFWCIIAVSIGAVIMLPFGLIFIGIAVYNAWYSYHNATAEDRFSVIDIVDEVEEVDPLNVKYGRKREEVSVMENNGTSAEYCPYCGKELSSDFEFCPKCGKKLPD